MENERYPFTSDEAYTNMLREELKRFQISVDWTSIPKPVIKDALAAHALRTLARGLGEAMQATHGWKMENDPLCPACRALARYEAAVREGLC